MNLRSHSSRTHSTSSDKSLRPAHKSKIIQLTGAPSAMHGCPRLWLVLLVAAVLTHQLTTAPFLPPARDSLHMTPAPPAAATAVQAASPPPPAAVRVPMSPGAVHPSPKKKRSQSLVGSFAYACPGCTDRECCTADAAAVEAPSCSSRPGNSEQGGSVPSSSPNGSPVRPRTRGGTPARGPRVTTEAPGNKGRDPADPTNCHAEFLRCAGPLIAAADGGSGAGRFVPQFTYSVPVQRLGARLATDPMHQIRDEHTEVARNVLRAALAYAGGSAEKFEERVYGAEVDQAVAQQYITDFVCAHRLQDKVWVRFTPNKVSCVGAIQRSMRNSQDVVAAGEQPVRHVMWVSTANRLRRHELRMFVAHEIGTHLLRVVNDEVQPWRGSAGRSKFGLHASSTREFKETEEGLASINTALHAGGGKNSRFLFREALLYYTAAMAGKLAFVDLFAHIAPYMPDPKRRFEFVTRIKRGIADQTQPGGSGKSQIYFEGAVNILRRVHFSECVSPSSPAYFDLRLLYSGRLMLSELSRVRRIAHMTTITLPAFAHDMEAYEKQLRSMAVLNGLVPAPVARPLGSGENKGRPVTSTGGSGKLPTLRSSQLGSRGRDDGDDLRKSEGLISRPAATFQQHAGIRLFSQHLRSGRGGAAHGRVLPARLAMRALPARTLATTVLNLSLP
jgi:hypothetical protein